MQRRHLTAVVTILVAAAAFGALGACDRSPPVSSGSLDVTIAGLPTGIDADVVVTGPGDFLALLVTSAVITDLAPGSYDVIAHDVAVGPDTYAASVEGAPSVVSGGAGASANVTYSATSDPDPDPDPDAPSIDSVTLVGHGTSLMARQGAGTLTLLVSGTNVADVNGAALGDLEVTLGPITEAGVELEVVVPHGATLGPRALELTAPTGTATLAAALEVSAITAGPDGDDAAGRGTPDAPFRSLTQAVGAAEPGDTVAVLAGAYGAGNGEAWPLVIEDLVVRGAGPATTVLEGGDDTLDGLDLRGNAHLEDLTVTGFRVGVRAAIGSPELRGVRSVGNALHGLQTGGAGLVSLVVVDSTFSENGQNGINAPSTAVGSVVTIDATSIEANLEQGLLASGSGSVSVTESLLRANNHRGVAIAGNVSLRLERTQVIDSNLDGVLASGGSELVMVDVEVRGSLQHGIDRGGTGRLAMRDSWVRNNQHDGVVVRNAAVADLGSALEPGGNRITATFFVGDLLADERQANATPAILAHGLELGDLEPPPSGVVTGPGANTPYWRITNAGNAIDFGP